MKVALVVVWTIVGLVAGVFVFGELAPLFGYRDMEGESAYFAVMVGAPVGALAALFGAIAFARAYAGNRRRLAQGFLVPFGVAVAIPLGVYLYETIRTYDWIDSYGDAFDLAFQVRLPEGMSSPAGAKVGIRLFSSKENPECELYDAPYGLSEDGGRFIVSGQCEIFYAVAERSLVVRIGDQPSYACASPRGRKPVPIPNGSRSTRSLTTAAMPTTPGARRIPMRCPRSATPRAERSPVLPGERPGRPRTAADTS